MKGKKRSRLPFTPMLTQKESYDSLAIQTDFLTKAVIKNDNGVFPTVYLMLRTFLGFRWIVGSLSAEVHRLSGGDCYRRSVVSDSATPSTAACQASLSFTISRSLLKLMSLESMMPPNYLILRLSDRILKKGTQ